MRLALIGILKTDIISDILCHLNCLRGIGLALFTLITLHFVDMLCPLNDDWKGIDYWTCFVLLIHDWLYLH